MDNDLIGFETVIDIVKGWPGEGDVFPQPAERDNQGRPLWYLSEIKTFAYQQHGVDTYKQPTR